MKDKAIESVLYEERRFTPPNTFLIGSPPHLVGMEDYQKRYQESLDNPEAFWANIAKELHWFKPWEQVLDDAQAPFYRWFTGGQTNLCYNCLDRHLDQHGDKPALLFEGEPGDRQTLSYRELYKEVCRLANTLKSLGIAKGDRVALYLPMIPILPAAVLACARIGAVHTVIFAGFSAESIKDRILDCRAKCVLTADGAWRRGKLLGLKTIVDQAVADCPCVDKVLVFRRDESQSESFPCTMQANRDIWYHEAAQDQSNDCPAEPMDAEDMLFLLYTSGTTGKPKGIIHTTGGYQVYAYLTAKYIFDLQPEDVYWCTADIGWITGHSYVVYGPMQNAVTQVIYEGAPDFPNPGRFWQIVEENAVSIFYTAPTAIRAFMKWGDTWPQQRNLSSLRLLGTVGEPINPEAWIWYHQTIGGERCPIVDTWWQTETGGIMITPLPGVTTTKPGSATLPFFGIDPAVLNDAGEEVDTGLLAIRKPWPGMLRGIYGDPQRYKDTYWCKWDGKYYFPGDGVRRDDDGYFWIVGRVDDVVNVSGHRIGTAELESVYIEHPAVAESAVIGVKHEIKGEGLLSFIIIRQGQEADDALYQALNDLVIKKIGKFAVPERIIFTPDLPKTRSGKIMRRLLRDIAEGRELGNVTTLADPGIVDSLKAQFVS